MKKPEEMNHYEILGILNDADEYAIKAAFKRKALEFHPDKNPNGTKMFQLVNTAYTVLSNPSERRIYDQTIQLNQTPARKQPFAKQTYSSNFWDQLEKTRPFSDLWTEYVEAEEARAEEARERKNYDQYINHLMRQNRMNAGMTEEIHKTHPSSSTLRTRFKTLRQESRRQEEETLNSLPKSLYEAVSKNNIRQATVFLRDYKETPNTLKKGYSCLCAAATNGNINMFNLLLKYNADVNLKDKNGNTALHAAVKAKQIEIVKLLLLKMENIDITNKNKVTPIDLAKTPEMKSLLQQYTYKNAFPKWE